MMSAQDAKAENPIGDDGELAGGSDDALLSVHGDVEEEGEEEKSTLSEVVFSIAFYVLVSLSIVFLNKYIFTYSPQKFDYPITMTAFQVLFAMSLMLVLCPLAQRIPLLKKILPLPNLIFSFEHIKAVFPCCVVFVSMVSFNNYCLSFVDVTMYLIFRSLTVLFSVGLTYVILKEKTGLITLLSLLIVTGGYIVGGIGGFSNQSYQSSKIVLGLVCGLVSSFFVALNSIVVKKTLKLPEFDGDHWMFLFYQNLVSFAIFIPITFVSTEIFDVVKFPYLGHPGFLFTAFSSAVLGFLINIAYNLLIKHTSPVTKETTATAKACLQPVLGYFIFGDPLTLLTGSGAIVCILGSFVYAICKRMGK